MNKMPYDVLNNINEGIVILNDELKVCLWNNYMESITGIGNKHALNNSIYEILPSLNRNYFVKAMNDSVNDHGKMFFSAAMHKDMINSKRNFNLQMSGFENDGSKFLLLEFIDVTNQFIQIKRLKDFVSELYNVNRELKEKEKVIKNLAYYDKMTGVANRTLFYELAEKFLNNAKRNNALLGLMFIDVDKFKSINDTYGHEVGDQVLIRVAKILSEATRKNDIVARHGGDEFLILLPNMKNINNYEGIVSRIINNKNKAVNFNGHEIRISLSIGISFYPNDADSIDKLIVKADKAMYTAKKRQGQDVCFCSSLSLS